MNTSLMLRAGLLLGAIRTVWIAVEHLVGARSNHLEWVEPSYGLFLFVGAPLTWFFLLRDRNQCAQPLSVKEILIAGLGAEIGRAHV